MDSVLTVVTPAANHNVTTLAIAKDELGITDTASDTRLARWIRECSLLIEAYISRVLVAEGLSETFKQTAFYDPFRVAGMGCRALPAPQRPLRLARYPVSAVSSVTEDGGAALVADTDYKLIAESGLLVRLIDGRHVSWSAQSIVVAYSAGYAIGADGLAPIEQACLDLIKQRYLNRDRDPNLRAITIPGVIEKQWFVGGPGQNSPIPPEIAARLDLFREVRT